MKGKALRKHSLQGKTAASVLLKLFISGNESMSETLFSNVNNIQSMIPEDQKNITTQCCITGRLFKAATQALKLN